MNEIEFRWPFNTEILYKLLIDNGLHGISKMYQGAVYKYLYCTNYELQNQDAKRQFCHSLREVLDHFGSIRKKSERSFSKMNLKGKELTIFFSEKLNEIQPQVQIFENHEIKQDTCDFLSLYRDFHTIKVSLPDSRLKWIAASILEISPRLDEKNEVLIELSKKMRDYYHRLSGLCHSEEPNLKDALGELSLQEILVNVTDLLIDCFPTHEIDEYEDLDSLIRKVEENNG